MKLKSDEIKSIFEEARKHKTIWNTQFKTDLIKSDFTLNLTSLTPWTDAEGQTLLSLAILGAPTRKLISRQDGVKYLSELKYLNTTSGLQPYTKGWNPAGETTVTVRNIYVTKMMSQELLYPEDLNDYSLQLSLSPGFNTELPFESLYGELKRKYIARDIEFYDWGTQSGGTYPPTAGASWAGLGNIIPAHAETYKSDTGATSYSFSWTRFLTGGTYDQLMTVQNAMINNLPEAIQGEKLTWFVSPAVFRKMLAVLRDGPTGIGNFNINVTDNDGTQSFAFPAYTNLEVVSTPGLSAENPNAWAATLITPAWNLVGVNDLMGEDEKFTLIWNPYALYGQFYCYFKASIDAYFYNYISYSA